jgi:hypothetical protein
MCSVTWLSLGTNIYVVEMWDRAVHWKSKLQNTGMHSATAWLPCCMCYPPAVFFHHLHLIVLSFKQGKIQHAFWKHWFFSVFKNCTKSEIRISLEAPVWLWLKSVTCRIPTTDKLFSVAQGQELTQWNATNMSTDVYCKLCNKTYTHTIIKTFKISINIWYKIMEANVSSIILSHLP